MAVTKYRSIADAPAPAAPDTAGQRLRLAFALSKTCIEVARAAGSPVGPPEGELLPSGRAWRRSGPHGVTAF